MQLKRVIFSDEVDCVLSAATYFAGQQNTEITLKGVLSGIYVGCFDRILMFWPVPSTLIRFVIEKLGLEEPVWRYWFAIKHELGSDTEDTLTTFDADLIVVLDRAAVIASKFDPGNDRPTLRLQHILAAIAESQDFNLCKEFADSGLDLSSLAKP
jgi:hypothetical protein